VAEQGAQYDHIEQIRRVCPNGHPETAESYTVLRMAGPPAGQRVLDLARGFGFYTRLFATWCGQVIGIDISPEMVRLGREQEQAEPLASLTWSTTPPISRPRRSIWSRPFICSTTRQAPTSSAAWPKRLRQPEVRGRFVAYTVNPMYTLRKPNGSQYGCYQAPDL
jgi:hypothetical protein